ncbi:MAG: tetratricopeptide repeat protein [Pseudomonadota bacterium]
MLRFIFPLLIAHSFVSLAHATPPESASPCLLNIDAALVKRAESGNAASQYKLGKELVSQACEASQYDKGLDLILEAATAGYPPAQFQVGTFLIADASTDDDKQLGIRFLTKSAEAGFVDAQTWLGVVLMSEAKVPHQRDQALYWIGSAANKGSIKAAMTAHLVYKEGLHGYSKDACAAALWKEAAEIMSGKSGTTINHACR